MSENKPIDLDGERSLFAKWWDDDSDDTEEGCMKRKQAAWRGFLFRARHAASVMDNEVESLRQRVRELEGNEEYRPLIAGEQILPSDECFANNTGPWKPMAKGIIEIYCPWNGNSGVHVPIRRKIPTPTEGAKE